MSRYLQTQLENFTKNRNFDIKFTFLLPVFLIVDLLFSGFINLIQIGDLYLATVIADSLVLVMVVLLVAKLIGTKYLLFPRIIALYISVLFVFLIVGAFNLGQESISSQLLAIRNEMLYGFVSLYILFFFTEIDQIHKLVRTIMNLGTTLAAFGIVQFIFRNSLPDWLLWSRDAGPLGYSGTDVVRSTGLVGNTIVFATVLMLIICLWISKFYYLQNWANLIGLLVTYFGILSTFSRVAIVCSTLLVLALFGVLIINKLRNSSRKNTLLVVVVFLLFGGLFIFTPIKNQVLDSFLVNQVLLGNNSAVQGSNGTRYIYIEKVISVLRDSPFVGQGLATQRQESNYSNSTGGIITDGIWLIVLAEGGFILFAAYLGWILFVNVFVIKKARDIPVTERFILLAFVLFSIYGWGIAAFVNTGLFGKAPFLLYWVLFGVILAIIQRSRSMKIS